MVRKTVRYWSFTVVTDVIGPVRQQKPAGLPPLTETKKSPIRLTGPVHWLTALIFRTRETGPVVILLTQHQIASWYVAAAASNRRGEVDRRFSGGVWIPRTKV
jgi:hypothetical protein